MEDSSGSLIIRLFNHRPQKEIPFLHNITTQSVHICFVYVYVCVCLTYKFLKMTLDLLAGR